MFLIIIDAVYPQVEIMMALEEKFEITLDEEGESTCVMSLCLPRACIYSYVAEICLRITLALLVWTHVQRHSPAA
jgi:hypothetical protein